MFKVTITSRAEREFAKLPKNLKQRFVKEFEKLAVNPLKHPQIKKLLNTEFGYRLRIGRWRILFSLFAKEKRIEIIDIFLKKGRQDYFRKKRLIK